MEDTLKEMKKKQAVISLVKLRGSEKYVEEIPSQEILSDLSRTPDGVSKFKGSKSFFSDILTTANAMRDIIGDELYKEIKGFVDPLSEKLGKYKLGNQEEISKGHQFIDLILAKLAKE